MEILFYLVLLVVIYFVYYYLILKKSNNLQDLEKSIEIKYLISRYQINFEKLEAKKVIKQIAFLNSFIIAITLFSIDYIETLWFKIIVAFVVLIFLQVIIYGLFAKYLKGKCKNV